MAIGVVCPQCQRKINAGDQFAGKRVKCPGCQAAIDVPTAGLPASASLPPAAASPPSAAGLWVRLPDGRQVGPLTQQALTQAVQQGQVNATCQIWQEGWPQPRWAAELFPALAQQAGVPQAMGGASGAGYPSTASGYPAPGYPQAAGYPQAGAHPAGAGYAGAGYPGASYPGATPANYAFDPLTGGYGPAAAQSQSPPALLGIPQVPWGSMQESSEKPKKKVRRDGPFGRASDGRGMAIAMSACGLLALQEIAMIGLTIYALSVQGLEPEARNLGLPCIRWILIGSATVGSLKRKKEARWLAVGLLLFVGLTCTPLTAFAVFVLGGFGPASILGALIVMDLVFAGLLSFAPSATIYYTEED